MRKRKIPNSLVVVAAAAMLSACATAPRYPLYSAATVTGSFGYAEQDLGSDRLRVSYDAPIRRSTDATVAERRQIAEATVQLADLALLRAAELAMERGAERFSIAERENDIRTEIDRGYGSPVIYDPLPWRYSYRYRTYPGPFFGAYPFPEDRAEIGVRVTFIATLHPDSAATGEFDAQSTYERQRAKVTSYSAISGT